MCGIIGYSGEKNAIPILLNGLKALEYRGYDSSGVSLFCSDKIFTVKAKGKIAEIEKKLTSNEFNSNCGIGHTRWATHGEPTETNAHPHFTENLSIVHNGIIENYIELREKLSYDGYTFNSETDTESALKLIDSKYLEYKNPLTAIHMAISELKGSYAFAIIFKDYPGKIFAVRKDSPLIVASLEKGCILASDLPALLPYTNTFYRCDDGEIAVLDENDIVFYDRDCKVIKKTSEVTSLSKESCEKNGFEHFMIKEIHDIPEAIDKTLAEFIQNGIPEFNLPSSLYDLIKNNGKITIVGCGTAMHSGLMGKHFIEKYARVSVDVEIASEYKYKNHIFNENEIMIAISQSGETADTLSALKIAKENGIPTIALVNCKGSTIEAEADYVIYTHAGSEIAVASTKAYTIQVLTLYLFAINTAIRLSKINMDNAMKMTENVMNNAKDSIFTILNRKKDISKLSESLKNSTNAFFIGRSMDYALSCEASLKLKEITYIHSEAYAAGELKHGAISLITKGTVVIAIASDKDILAKTISNMKEVKARGGNITVICPSNFNIPCDCADNILFVPQAEYDLSFLTISVCFQLLAYYTAIKRGCDVDKPRNLAKSVTVE